MNMNSAENKKIEILCHMLKHISVFKFRFLSKTVTVKLCHLKTGCVDTAPGCNKLSD